MSLDDEDDDDDDDVDDDDDDDDDRAVTFSTWHQLSPALPPKSVCLPFVHFLSIFCVDEF